VGFQTRDQHRAASGVTILEGDGIAFHEVKVVMSFVCFHEYANLIARNLQDCGPKTQPGQTSKPKPMEKHGAGDGRGFTGILLGDLLSPVQGVLAPGLLAELAWKSDSRIRKKPHRRHHNIPDQSTDHPTKNGVFPPEERAQCTTYNQAWPAQ
jgi:hypothetical protein